MHLDGFLLDESSNKNIDVDWGQLGVKLGYNDDQETRRMQTRNLILLYTIAEISIMITRWIYTDTNSYFYQRKQRNST